MTKANTKQALISKINQVNKSIEIKIAMSESYKTLAIKHYKLYQAKKAL